jgi:hypothetical protein
LAYQNRNRIDPFRDLDGVIFSAAGVETDEPKPERSRAGSRREFGSGGSDESLSVESLDSY